MPNLGRGAVCRQAFGALLSARRGGLYLRMFKINYFQFSFTVIGREEDANAKKALIIIFDILFPLCRHVILFESD